MRNPQRQRVTLPEHMAVELRKIALDAGLSLRTTVVLGLQYCLNHREETLPCQLSLSLDYSSAPKPHSTP